MPLALKGADTLKDPGCLLSLLLPENRHMHTKWGTYTSPRMREQRVRTPASESAEKGMFLGEPAGGGGWRREEGSKPGGLPPRQTIINKDGNGDFQRRSGCTQHRALAWMHLPARERLVPWGSIAISERLGVGVLP